MTQGAARESGPGAGRARSREERPKMIEGVETWVLFEPPRSDTIYIIGHKDLDRFVVVPGRQFPPVSTAARLLDGRHSLASIEEHLARVEGKRVDVAALHRRFVENGLIEGTPREAIVKTDFEKNSLRLLTIPVKGLFRRLEGIPRWFVPGFALFGLGLIVAALIVTLWPGNPLAWKTQAATAAAEPKRLLVGSALLFASFFFHEIAHGVVAVRNGVVPTRFEVGLYLGFIPMFYLRIAGLYTIERRRRLAVWAAGIYWNLSFASACVLTIRLLPVSPAYRELVRLAAGANYMIAVLNLVPFLPTDGYFLLCTLLRRYNVRRQAWREFRKWASRQPHRFAKLDAFYLIGVTASLTLLLIQNGRFIRRLSRGGAPPDLFRIVLFVLPVVLLAIRWSRERGFPSRTIRKEHS